jgi:amino acid transporter
MGDNQKKLDLKAVVAMGVGGMVGGGIFSVLGLAIGISGHAAPVVFAIGGVIALLTGLSYAKLGLAFRSAGGSFTYLEHSAVHHNVAGIAGWLLLAGYVGTLALYAYTFGAYGAAMLGAQAGKDPMMHHLLASAVLLIFMCVNLYGAAAVGESEVLIVIVKVAILALFAFIGIFHLKEGYVLPIFNKGITGVIVASGLIFVAYEGFELIPNAIEDMNNPEKNLCRGIVIPIVIATVIYIIVSLVAVGNLTAKEVQDSGEYALAIAAKPFLGHGGFVLISLAALLSTASAINATLFGTARLGSVMATEHALPGVFSFREKRVDVPWVSLVAITIMSLVFVNTTDLTKISSFASSIFLLIFAAINLSAFRLRRKIGACPAVSLTGCAFAFSALLILFWHLFKTDKQSLCIIAGMYIVTIIAELVFSKRRLFLRKEGKALT